MSKNKYSEDQLRESALKYFDGDILATNVWIKKYALKDGDKFLELNPDDTIRRLADEISRAESQFPNPLSHREIYNTLKDFKYFIFAGSILFGAGNNNSVSLANCFFIDNKSDSYGGIFNTDESMAQLMKRRGGVGVTIEHLRPQTANVNNSAQSSTGAVSFMHRFSSTTREVAQDGRRGALMISCHIHHPDILDFIHVKDDLTKVTGANVSVKVTDEFMKAVEHNEDFILHWPVQQVQPKIDEMIPYNKLIKTEDGKYLRRVKAKDIWLEIVNMAHKNAEPGVLFWDNIISESPADAYSRFGFETRGTNPCVTGDTLVSVADGRNVVPIKQLAEEGKDVPVYSLNDKGKIEIQLMRNPRITGYNQPIYEVTLDSGDKLHVTPNHKIRLKNGTYKEAKDLIYGDSLHIMSRTQLSWDEIINSSSKSKSKSTDYMWIQNGSDKLKYSEHKLIYEFENNLKIPNGHVIHHKDFNSLNNYPDNLEMMEAKAHNELHSNLIKGKKNPYHKMSDDWKKKFASKPGKLNGNYSGISNFKLYKEIIRATKEKGARLTINEWKKYVKTNNLNNFPIILHSNYRGGGIYLLKRAALYLKYDYANKDNRIVKRYLNAISQGYNAKITDDNHLIVERTCEECNNKFWTNFDSREYATCSISCSNKFVNRTTNTNKRRISTINETYKKKAIEKTEIQLKSYSDLKFILGRNPTQKEWENECKKNGSTGRLGSKHDLKNYKEVRELAEDYNHKVISVEHIGFDTVYNGTVDKYHNFFSGGFKESNKEGKSKWLSINQMQCGEVPLSSHDSCRLGSINLFSFVNDPFTKNAKFNFGKLAQMTRRAQRFMDDIVYLEEEKITKIIDKIKNDPEPDHIKDNELFLWEKILSVLRKGRRTGLGVLGLGDACAALNIKFGSIECTKLGEQISKVMAVNSYLESVNMAKERGAFPIWNTDIEANNPFIIRTISDHFNNEEYNDYLKYGRRNIANLSIAPTGSLAILGQTTSGIEPVFKVYYRRRRKVNPNETDVNVNFVDQNGDSWEEYNVIHKPFEEWYINQNGGDSKLKDELRNKSEDELDHIVSTSPWSGSESHDIDYVEKVNMQGAIQKWVDHSISITHNLPEDISVEKVNDIYFQGWKSKCKGITIYRDGSRSGVLLTNKESESEEFPESNAPKRPEILNADYYVGKAKGIQYAVIVGLYEDKKSKTQKPYEIFAFENPPSTKNTKGIIKKVKKGHYKFINGEFEIDNIELAAERIEERTLSIAASMLLRHGAPIPHILSVIKKIDENVTSFSSVIRRYLSRYIEEEKEVKGEPCPNCGDKLIMQDGCVKCVNPECGYSRCG